MTNTPVRHTAARVGATTQPTSLTRRALYAAGTVITMAAMDAEQVNSLSADPAVGVDGRRATLC